MREKTKPQLCIYVVEFGDGMIKVGYTQWPQGLSGRYRETKLNKRPLKRIWYSESHTNARTNETTLKRWCMAQPGVRPQTGKSSGPGSGPSEWYYGLKYDEVVAYADQLPRVLPDEREAIAPSLDVDWYAGTATILFDDEIVHAVDMSDRAWVGELMLAFVASGGNGKDFMISCLLPVLSRAGQEIPPLLRETYEAP